MHIHSLGSLDYLYSKSHLSTQTDYTKLGDIKRYNDSVLEERIRSTNRDFYNNTNTVPEPSKRGIIKSLVKNI